MRRVVMTAAIAVTLAGLAIGPPAVSRQRDDDWRQRECRYQSLQPGVWTPTEESLTARCAVARWSVPGGIGKFTAVGSCESGWNRLASNAGRYLGLFQHARPYWPGRVHLLEPAGWELRSSWQNSRTQIVVTARMVHASGWTAWSCA